MSHDAAPRPRATIADLAPGDRFISGGSLWTYLGLLIARKHGPESLALKGLGLGYSGDSLCSFLGEDPVEFVAPGDEEHLRWALGWVRDAVLGKVPSKPAPRRIADVAEMALSGIDSRQSLREQASPVPGGAGPTPSCGAHPAADALAALAEGNPAAAAIKEIAARVARLEDANAALAEIESRLRERTGPILALIEAHRDAPDRREILEAWKWAIYGSAIHAQAFAVPPAEPSP